MPSLLTRSEFVTRTLSAACLTRLPLRAAGEIKVGMIPDAGATQVSIDEKVPLQEYLAKAIGVPVDLIIPTNYNATVEALGNGSLDFAYLGALTYVKAHQSYNVIPLVQRSADKNFHSLFITQSGSAIQKLADSKGKRFAFGDINSTSGHLIPYLELSKAGINADEDMQIRYTGSHAATVKAVEGGAADAGALDETVYHHDLRRQSGRQEDAHLFHLAPVRRLRLGGAQGRRRGATGGLREGVSVAQRRPGRRNSQHPARQGFRARRRRRIFQHPQNCPRLEDVVSGPDALPAADYSLSIRDLVVRYGKHPVLNGISLEVARGERVAILGPSGAGKTSLLRAINGFVPYAAGSVLVVGVEVGRTRGRSRRALRCRIGVVSQRHDLVENLSVLQNVMAGALGRWSSWRALRFLAWPMRDEIAEAEAALKRVGLEQKLRSQTSSLSGGEHQRVAIARALVQQPVLLLADEPVASLDPALSEQTLELLCGLAEESNVTLLCSLHQPHLAERYFDRIVEMRDHKIARDRKADKARFPEQYYPAFGENI